MAGKREQSKGQVVVLWEWEQQVASFLTQPFVLHINFVITFYSFNLSVTLKLFCLNLQSCPVHTAVQKAADSSLFLRRFSGHSHGHPLGPGRVHYSFVLRICLLGYDTYFSSSKRNLQILTISRISSDTFGRYIDIFEAGTYFLDPIKIGNFFFPTCFMICNNRSTRPKFDRVFVFSFRWFAIT